MSSRSLRSRLARSLAAVASCALLATVAACGAESDTPSNAAGNTNVAVGGAQFSTADQETAKLGSDAEPGAFPRTVKHSAGETTIEKKPVRVIALDTGEIDQLISLGITPVGIAKAEGADGKPSYLADELGDVEFVGTINELNLEKIASLKPDLILGSTLRAEKLYAKLSEIAPTVFSIRPGFPWKENFLLTGDALGEETKAKDVLNAYQAKASEIRKAVPGDPTISLVRFMPEKIRLYANKSFIGVILNDVGLKRPEIQNIDDLAVEVSAENIDKAEGDWIFYCSYGSTAEETVTSSALWKQLGAVKNSKAKPVDDDVWFLGLGPTGAMDVLDDLEELLGKD